MVTQFLDYSRPARAAFAPGDVNEILRRTLALLQAQIPAQVKLTLELAPDLPRVACDAEQLRQVFLNLSLNALQAMPRGGALHVTTRLARDDAGALARRAPAQRPGGDPLPRHRPRHPRG